MKNVGVFLDGGISPVQMAMEHIAKWWLTIGFFGVAYFQTNLPGLVNIQKAIENGPLNTH